MIQSIPIFSYSKQRSLISNAFKLITIMGNVAQEGQQQAETANNKKLPIHKYLLQIRDRQIILSYRDKIKITIGDVLSFPAGGFEGLHLWDSNVILARYILINRMMFAGKSILELLSGTGLATIAARKFTTAHSITATDRSQEVTNNIIKNCSKNNVEGIQVACITWAEYSKKQSRAKFNYIIGADLLFKGCPVELLLSMFDKYLAPKGKVIMIVPFKNGEDNTVAFSQNLDPSVWAIRKQKLTDEIYMESPLLNQVEGYEQFKQISEGHFYLYTLQRTIQADKDFTQIKQSEPMVKKVGFKKQQPKGQQQIEIKVQNMEQNEIKLQIVKVSKTEDKPEYERKKRKTITEIIAEKQETKAAKDAQKSGQIKEESKIETKEQQLPKEPQQQEMPSAESDKQKQKQGLNNAE